MAVAELDWADVCAVADDWADAIAADVQPIKRAVCDVPVETPIGYHIEPETLLVGVHAPAASDADLGRAKCAALRAVGPGRVCREPLTDTEACLWVKVAVSPLLRRTGELLNFFPGKYPGGMPNAPSPLAAMLTTALVGGGLGYGTGRMLESVLPESWERGRLRKTLGTLGALGGAGVAVPWAVSNLSTGHGLLSPKPLDGGPEPEGDPVSFYPSPPEKTGEDLPPLGQHYLAAVAEAVKEAEDGAGAFGFQTLPEQRSASPLDVDIDAIGRVLWTAGASPRLAGTAMSTLYAAQQMPDPSSRPNVATGHQLGQLAMNAGADYLTGALVGAILNRTTGLPITANTAGLANVAIGIIGSAIPKLFG